MQQSYIFHHDELDDAAAVEERKSARLKIAALIISGAASPTT